MTRQRWFFGPVPDLLFGAGLLYVALFGLQAVAGSAMRQLAPLDWMPVLALLLGGPHYGATLLRVYEARSDRRKYALFAVWATLALVILFVWGLYSVAVGSALLTVYLVWSPWHYSGQNYGIALLFLRRRGIPVTPIAKRALYASFLASFALVFMSIHGTASGSASDYAPANYQGTVFSFISLGVPPKWQLAAAWLLCGVYGVSLGVAATNLLSRASLRTLFPALLVILTQALWFALPTVAVQMGWLQGIDPLSHENRAYAFMWVAAAHFAQYLWITCYYAAAAEDRAGRLRYLGKTLLVGSALWVFPTFVFAPNLLGSLPFDSGLALLTASAVNIHHFILDGAVWKLRDGRVARMLLRSQREFGAVEERSAGSGLRAAFAVGAFCLVVSLGLKLDLGRTRAAFARAELPAVRSGLAHRAWFGRDSARLRLELARLEFQAGDTGAALRSAERSATLLPSAAAHALLARLHAARGDPEAAGTALRAAVDLDANDPEVRKLVAILERLGRD